MTKFEKSLILLPVFALLISGCTPKEDVPEVKDDDTTSECEGDECTLTEGNGGGEDEGYNYDSAYALVGDFTDSSWKKSPSESSKYYLAYDSTKKESMYWEVTVTMEKTSYAPSFYVTEYGQWSLVAGFESLNPYSLGVDFDSGTNDGGIQCTAGGTYNITIDMTGNDTFILVEQQYNLDDYYVLVGDFEDNPTDDWTLTPTNEDYYLWFDSSDSSSMYWKVTINIGPEPDFGGYDPWYPGLRVVDHNTDSDGKWITIADYNNRDEASTGTLSSTNTDNNILVSEWGYTYDLAIDFRDTSNKKILVTQATVTSDDAILNDDGSFKSIDGIDSDYIMGMDVSSIEEVLTAGGKFYDYDGKELADIDAYMKFLAENGVNYARIRLWNNPNDTSGNSYEGGGNDITTDLTIAKAATDAGMKICLDFHYSDFWAHHGQQFTPKAWTSYNASTKASIAASWTTDILGQFKSAGCDIGMVQVGNETNNNQICGLTSSSEQQNFFKQCCAAVRTYDSSIKIVVHYAMDQYAANYINNFNALINAGVDFDVMGLSFYPYWHTKETLQYVLAQLKSSIPTKEICVMEYAYAWTTDWSYVASSRTLSDQGGGVMQNDFWTTEAETAGYDATVDGQAQCVYDINKAVADAGGIGSFYWEPGWLAVDGSSWASSYAASYYTSNGTSTSGYKFDTCSWANQAFFNYSGKALDSLKVYSQMIGE